MKNKIDRDLLEKGIKELDKVAYNRLESAVEEADKGKIQYAIEFALDTEKVARGVLQNTRLIEDYFHKNGRKIKERFELEIQGYTK